MKLAACALAVAALTTACDDHDHADTHAHADAAGGEAAAENVEAEGCEHLAEGPATALTAAAPGSAEVPAVSDDHTRYDITVATADGVTAGVVEFASDAAGEHSLFFNTEVGLEVTGPDGAVVPVDHAHTSSTLCAEIKYWAIYDLDVGTYRLRLSPAQPGVVGLVIEAGHGHAL